MMCLAPMVAVLGVLTLQPNAHHVSNLDGLQIEAQSCVTGFGLYVTAASAELYTGGVQYGYAWPVTAQAAVIGQVHVGASYPSRWVPELPNQVQFDVGARLLVRLHRSVLELAWQHDSHAGLGHEVVRDGRRWGNTGLDLIKLGVGWVF